MTLLERISAAIVALPDSSSVVFEVWWLREQLEAGGEPESTTEPLADLTVADLAAELGRAPSTIRGWLVAGEIEGAYRLKGREWRIPRTAARRFLDRQATDPGSSRTTPRSGREAGVGGWRRHRPNLNGGA